MKERPILFTGPMVRAILEGRKTQTRRPVKNACDLIEDWDPRDSGYGPFFQDAHGDFHKTIEKCPYGQPGDVLWVRETWAKVECTCQFGGPPFVCTECTGGYVAIYRTDADEDGRENIKWSPSIHMPKWACRLWLTVTDVRVERLVEITYEDCRAEGCSESYKEHVDNCDAVDCHGWHYGEMYHFMWMWNEIYGDSEFEWRKDPWVWVIEFERKQA